MGLGVSLYYNFSIGLRLKPQNLYENHPKNRLICLKRWQENANFVILIETTKPFYTNW